MLDNADLVRTVGGEVLRHRRDIGAGEQHVDAGGKALGDVASFFHAFEARLGKCAVSGLGDDDDGCAHQTALPAFSPSMMAACARRGATQSPIR